MNKGNKIIVLVIVLLIIFAVLFVVFRGNESNSASDSTQSPLSNSTDTENQSQQENTSELEGDPSEPETKKPVTNVVEKPTSFTGFGNNSAKPLPLNQTTSTTCSTEPNTKCMLIMTNQDTKKVVTFETQTTDAQGATRWEWTNGKEITSGTWSVIVKAGDKTSEESTVYVQ